VRVLTKKVGVKQQRERCLRMIVHRQMERMQLVDVPAERLSFAASLFFVNLSINQPV
jgi:hypothetical protein